MSWNNSATKSSGRSSVSASSSAKRFRMDRSGAQFLEVFDGDERMLIHGVAVIEVANHQALDLLPFRDRSCSKPVSCIARSGQRRVRQREAGLQSGPHRCRELRSTPAEYSRDRDPPLGFERQRHAVPRNEFEQAQHQRRDRSQLLR